MPTTLSITSEKNITDFPGKSYSLVRCGTLGRYWYALFAVLGLIAAFIVAWIVDIACRPVVNPDGLKGALDARSRSKVHGNRLARPGSSEP